MNDETWNAPDPADAIRGITGESPTPPLCPHRRYTVRGLWEIACIDLPEIVPLWSNISLEHGAVVEVIGAPSIGKSRLVGDLARHQILGRDFGGRPTSKTPLRWLFVGSENGINRLNYETMRYLFRRNPSEVCGMSEADRLALAESCGFTHDDIRLLETNFRTFTLENPEDFDIVFGDENQDKFLATLEDERPDVLVIDPWGDAIDGTELDDKDIRATIRNIRNLLADAGLRQTLIVIVNHARMGAKEEASANGLDAGNYGKNSKCLFSISRNVFNIRRASMDENPDIEVIHAKCSNAKRTTPLALHLDSESMSYEVVPDFDHEAWQRQLEEAAKGTGKGGSTVVTAQLTKDALHVIGDAGDEMLSIKSFGETMQAMGYKTSQVRAWLVLRRNDGGAGGVEFFRQLWKNPKGRVCHKPTNQHGVEFISTPETIDAYCAAWHWDKASDSLVVSCSASNASNI